MADVFVSYARSDKARVAPLVAAIEAKGWSVWWDPEISPGQEFDRQITAALKTAAVVVVVWTPTSVESRWVRGKARDAAERGILVPVRCMNLGTTEHPRCEGTPPNVVAYFASFPFGATVYTTIAYIWLSRRASEQR